MCLSSLLRYWLPSLPRFEGATKVFSPLYNFFAYFPVFHLPTFIFGMALGRLFLQPRHRGWKHQNLLFLGSITAVSLLFAGNGRLPPILLTDAVLVPLFGVLIVSAASCTGTLQRLFSSRWLVELGEASYAVYILHVPLIFWTCAIWRRLPFLQHTDGLVLFFFYWAVLLSLCTAAFEYFEKPLRRLLVSRLSTRFAPAPVKLVPRETIAVSPQSRSVQGAP